MESCGTFVETLRKACCRKLVAEKSEFVETRRKMETSTGNVNMASELAVHFS